MINKIVWKRNHDYVEKLLNSKKMKIIDEIEKSFEVVEINLSKNNFLTSESINTVGKTMILHSLQYVMGEHINSKDDSLIKIINSKYNNLINENGEYGESNFIYSYDFEIEFTFNSNVYRLLRKMDFNPNQNEPYKAVDEWIIKNISTNNERIINRKELMNNTLPNIFSSWPDSHGYKNLALDYNKNFIKTLDVQTYKKMSVHQYNQFFYKKQFQSTDKTSSPSFFSRYPYWNEMQYRSIIYSLFEDKLSNKTLSSNLLDKSNSFKESSKKMESLKLKTKFLKKEIAKYDNSRKLGIDENSVKKVKAILNKIDSLSSKLQPCLNDYYTNTNKFSFDIQKEIDTIYKSDYYNKMDLISKSMLEEYLLLVKELKNEWENKKVDGSIDSIIGIMINESEEYLNKMNLEIIEIKKEISSDFELHKDNFKIINNISEKVGEKIKLLEGETGAEFNKNETSLFIKMVSENSRTYPYLFIDEFSSSVDDSKIKEESLLLPLGKLLSNQNKFEQAILTTAKINENEIKKFCNSENFAIIKIEKQLFKEKCESKYILQR